jgi:hypothetical protein
MWKRFIGGEPTMLAGNRELKKLFLELMEVILCDGAAVRVVVQTAVGLG